VHREWLSAQTFEQVNTELALIDNLAACEGLIARREALDERLSWVALDPEFWPTVRRLRAFRGLDTLSALIIVLEVADFTRFPRAAQLGSWLGLVPSREQSGESDRHGSITKTGSKYARRILVEAAWHYARPPRIGTDAVRAPTGAARPHRADRAARPAPPAPDPQTDARTQEARQRDHGRVRARARLLPLGRRHRSITPADSPLPLGWGGAGPRSPLARAELLWAALTKPRPLLDTRSPATKPGTWGSQPPHMRLTDVENFARRLPTRAHLPTNPQRRHRGGRINAAHLTNVPPYE
jgi:hypothetical protein